MEPLIVYSYTQRLDSDADVSVISTDLAERGIVALL